VDVEEWRLSGALALESLQGFRRQDGRPVGRGALRAWSHTRHERAQGLPVARVESVPATSGPGGCPLPESSPYLRTG